MERGPQIPLGDLNLKSALPKIQLSIFPTNTKDAIFNIMTIRNFEIILQWVCQRKDSDYDINLYHGFGHHWLPTMCHTPHTPCHMSHATHHTPHPSPHTTHCTPHMPHPTCHPLTTHCPKLPTINHSSHVSMGLLSAAAQDIESSIYNHT